MYANGRGVLKDDAEAVKWYRLAAEQGHADAQFYLGVMYANGPGRPQGRCRSRALVPAGRRTGRGHSAVQPRGHVRHGRGVLKDDAEAVRWYRLAAEQGEATAQFNLGIMCANGEGVLKDSVLAHMWSNIAGANGTKRPGNNETTSKTT